MMESERKKNHWTTQTFCHVILLIWKAVIPNCCINIGHVSNSIKNSDEFHTWFVCSELLVNNIMLCSAFIKIHIFVESKRPDWISFMMNFKPLNNWILYAVLCSVFGILCSTSLYAHAHCAHSKSFIISNERWCFVLFSKSLNNSSQWPHFLYTHKVWIPMNLMTDVVDEFSTCPKIKWFMNNLIYAISTTYLWQNVATTCSSSAFELGGFGFIRNLCYNENNLTRCHHFGFVMNIQFFSLTY